MIVPSAIWSDLASGAVYSTEGLMSVPTDPGAAPETKRLLDHFSAISGLRTLSGQHSLYWQWHDANEPAIVAPDQHVKNTIGKIPGVFGTDFGDGQDAFHLQKTVDLIKQQAAAGRIITVSYHFPRPKGGALPQPSGTLAEVVDPANTTARPDFFARIEELVTLLRQLDVNGARVPVIFRPLHEMNGPWFWYGKKGAADLQTLWKEIWNRFHNRANPAENLHNVLWMFSANAWLDSGSFVDPPTPYYPGHAVVDMLGVDLYKENDYNWHQEYHDGLRTLGANRPIAITENGQLPPITMLRAGGQTHWVYWLTWFDRYSTAAAGDGKLPDNSLTRYQAALNEPSVVWCDPDVYISDVPTDIGLTIPSAEYVDDAAGRHWWYESPDIKVDANPAAAVDLTDPGQFEAFPGESPKRNGSNNLYVRVHNHGPAFALNVKIKCLWTDATAGIPSLPADYWQYFPDAWMAPSPWNPVDPTNPYAVIASIPPRSSWIVKIPWQVPATAAAHTCLLAMATCTGNALIGNNTTGVRNEKRIALRNVHVIDNNVAFPVKMLVHMYPVRPFLTTGELAIDTGELHGGRIIVAIDQRSQRRLRELDGKTMSFRRAERATADRGVERFELRVQRDATCGAGPERLPRISGIELNPERAAVVELEWSPDEHLEPGSTHVLRVLQFEDEMLQGGSTFLIRMPSKGRA
jgi:mannan endo-1,4-beta-mannosidase